jgi:hypothetical protein
MEPFSQYGSTYDITGVQDSGVTALKENIAQMLVVAIASRARDQGRGNYASGYWGS